MGHGGRFKEDRVPTGTVITAYAALGNMADAVKRTEELVDRIGADPNDSEAWKGLELYAERLKTRGMTVVQTVKSLLRSQEKGQ